MNILMLHPHDIYSPAEPWTIRIKNMAKEFVSRGHQVSLVYFPVDTGRHWENFWEEEGMTIIPLSRSPEPRTFFINIKRIVGLVEKADIVHFQKCHYYSALPAVIASYTQGKPLHYDWDDWETKIWFKSNYRPFRSQKAYLHIQWMGLFFRILERFLPELADTISVSSQRLKDLCLSWGIDEKKIYNAPVGGDLEKFRPGLDCEHLRMKHNLAKKKVVLYLGQLHAGQYAELFIRAADVVLRKCPETIFMVLGEGVQLSRLRKLAVDLRVEYNVLFTGAVPHNKIPNYLSLAEVCVACFEDNDVTRCKSPLKIAEYLAAGKAIVASNVGEVRNMVGGVGLLVSPGNYKEIAQGILKVLTDDSLRIEMGKRARRRAEVKYNWVSTADSLLNAFGKAINSKANF